MSKYQLIIPMSGVGQRFKDAGYKELKPFIRIDGKTVIEHILEMYPDSSDVLFILNEADPELELHKQTLLELRPKSKVVCIAPHKKGPGFAIWEAKDFVNRQKPVIVNYADFSGRWDFDAFLSQLKLNDGNILTYTGFNPHMLRSQKFAYVKTNDSGEVIDIQEKSPFTAEPMGEHASAGAYGFISGEILLAAIEKQMDGDLSVNGEFYISLTYKPLLEAGKSIAFFDMYSFNQWGTPEDLEDWIYWNREVKIALQPLLSAEARTNQNLLLLAAGKGSRIVKVSNVEKPFISVGSKKLWQCSINTGIQYEESILITRKALEESFHRENFSKIIALETETSGQAASALLGLRAISNKNLPTTILSCDNILSEVICYEFDGTETTRLAVWVVRDYPPARLKPESYSWVNVDDEGNVKSVHIKSAPPNPENAYLVIGNFSFRTAQLAIEMCESVVGGNITVNDEHYLDSLIQIELEGNRTVGLLVLNHFIALGTMEEFRVMKHYEAI